MKHLSLWAALVVVAALSLHADPLVIGAKVEKVTLQDTGGSPLEVQLTGGITVVTFISTKCPISNDYNDRMSGVYRDYSAKGVNFVFVNANMNEPAAEVEQHAASVGFPFKVRKDDGSALADKFGATVTPEAYVFDKTGTLLYHGFVDDSRNAARIQVNGLRDALDAVVEGKTVSRQETKAFGCTIKRAKKAS